MTASFSKLTTHDIQTLANALRSGRLVAPYTTTIVGRSVPGSLADEVVADLMSLEGAGFSGQQIAVMLDVVHSDRKSRRQLDELIDLVTTGPEAPGITNRDTSVVVRELFRRANRTVMIAGYAIYQGQQVFQALADRMEETPSLDARLYLNLSPDGSTDPESLIVRRFANQFKAEQWPKQRPLPKVFYDPRSIDPDRSKRASLHAKCIVVDSEEVFISSANFTERAQHRNIEVGVRITSPKIADQLTQHFAKLVDQRVLKTVPL